MVTDRELVEAFAMMVKILDSKEKENKELRYHNQSFAEMLREQKETIEELRKKIEA